MLTDKSIELAKPLQADLSQRGLGLVPVKNSPLEALVRESIPGYFGNDVPLDVSKGIDAGVSGDGFSILERANSTQPGTEIKPHDMVLDEIIPIVSKAVTSHVSHARTVVVPWIDTLVTDVKEMAAAITPSSLLSAEVILFSPPEFFTNPVFENSIKKYESQNYEPGYVTGFAFPDIDLEMIKKLLKTGSAELDKQIEQWEVAMGDNFFLEIWEGFFQGKDTWNLHSYVRKNNGKVNASIELNLDRLLAIHLIARNLFDKPPVPEIGISLSNYNDITSTLRNISGVRILLENTAYYRDITQLKTLIRSMNGSKVVVNAPVYKKWIADGGENEVLFGNSLTRYPVYDVDRINERKQALLTEWNRHCAIISTNETIRRSIRLKDIFRSSFRGLVAKDEEENLNKQEVINRFEALLETVRDAEFNCIYTLARRLVCQARFPHTDAEEILASIDQVVADNPKLDIREAATISVINYIASWIAHQMQVV